MTKIYADVARFLLGSIGVLLGLIFVVAVIVRVWLPQIAGSAGFPAAAQAWLDVMNGTGYMQQMLYLTEFVGGGALLINRFVPLALIALAPITLNITLFHAVLDPRFERIVQILFMSVAHLVLIYVNRRSLMVLIDKVDPIWSGLKFKFFDMRSLLQILLGLLFIVAGGAKLLIPDRLSVGDFLVDGMKATGYIYSLLGVTELICGLMLAIGLFTPLVLAILAPIVVNIFLYHLYLNTAGLVVAVSLVLVYLALIATYSRAYYALFQLKVNIA